MVIRRRTGLVAAVAVSSALLAAAYFWRFTAYGGSLALLVAGLLSIVAVVHGLAWSGARTSLLVADGTGLRVRLGAAWIGLPWSEVERVELQDRGRLSDGSVAIRVADGAAALAGAGWRTRLAGRSNAWLYGAPLAVPVGLATSVTTDDLAGELERLADGRADVVVPAEKSDRREPNATPAIAPVSVGTPVDDETLDKEEMPVRPWGAELSPAPAPDLAPVAPVAPVVAAREAAFPPLRRVVSAFRTQPARREEVTIAMRREVTEGTLALSPSPEQEYTDQLPEIAELRRATESEDVRPAPTSGGNVALIIDATTDLSARAMSKVRYQTPGSAEGNERDDRDDQRRGEIQSLVIGHKLREARETLRLSVDDLADRTRIRPFVIECMEADDFSPCGGDFYARGHLRMLARVLGIASEPLIATYDDKFATSPINPRAVFDVELATGTTGMIRGGAAGANWGGLIAAVLILVLIWGVARFFADGSSAAPATRQPTQNSSGLGSPGVGNAPILTLPDVHIQLTALGGDSRVVVRDSSKDVIFQGALHDGDFKKVAGEPPLRVFAADAGVIRLAVKGDLRGALGKPGQPATTKVTAHPPRSSRGKHPTKSR